MALTADQAAFVTGGVSITAGSRDRRRVPSVMKACGVRVDAGLARVTLLLPAPASRQLLADIAATGEITAVFSRPSTHHTLQVKGSDASETPLQPGDAALAAAHRDAFADDLVPLGYPRAWALAIHEPVELVAVTFTAQAVYAQTPGPGAGARLEQPS